MIEISEISILGRLIRYLLHGLVIGSIVIVLSAFNTIMFTDSYFIRITLCPILMYAPFFAVAFALVGGVNQTLVERIWNIKCEQSIGDGMRDGAIFYILFNVFFLPVSIFIQGFILYGNYGSWQYFPDTVLVILIIAPLFMVIAGAIGERLAIFLYVDSEPEPPPDYSEHSYTCSHCGARYYYGLESRSKGVLTCQNCARDFDIIVD
ncbi:MAG: hypothetical protein E4H14_11600 [Candidatus Thorarchaeota archaeon]|nr:MAG: hypothetical protein E4H14_11600 [Candidatus Thorarchaeota archaeon]